MKRNAIKGKRRKIKLELDKKGEKSKERRKQKSQKNGKIPLHCFTLHSLVWEMDVI